MLSIQNINLNDVLFLLSFRFLFIVSAVVYCYLRSAIRTFIATSLLCMWRRGVRACARARVYVCVICAYMSVYIYIHVYIPSITFTY